MAFWNGTRWVREEPAPATLGPRRTRRLLGATLEATLIVALIFGLIAGSAFAAKGGNGGSKGGAREGSSSIGLLMVVDRNGDGAPNWNDSVTFDVSTTATDKPWVLLNCYQGGVWVSTATAGFFEAYPWDPYFTLASGGWTSGAGDCVATLYMVMSNGKNKTLATASFHVGA